MLGTAGSGVPSTKLADLTKKPNLQYAVPGALLVWALVAQLTFMGFIVYVQANAAYDLGAPFTTRVYKTRILYLAAGYENSARRRVEFRRNAIAIRLLKQVHSPHIISMTGTPDRND
jgi:hypothetical protein